MLRANIHASSTDGASLLCIDEINRGPAVAIFGDTLTAIESDKRLGEDNEVVTSASPFYAYGDDGVFKEFHLSPHLYILACMNEADTSVEPLDVAFLRRFSLYRLFPDETIAKTHLRITEETNPSENDETIPHLYLVLWKAWKEVNRRISLGRSAAFTIGHGVLMWKAAPTEIGEARLYASECWRRIEAHVDEVFFGNDQAKGIVYNAGENTTYNLREEYFGDQPVIQLRKKNVVDIYKMLREISLAEGE
jgi:5-methylcytosine-specific restriction protein B